MEDPPSLAGHKLLHDRVDRRNATGALPTPSIQDCVSSCNDFIKLYDIDLIYLNFI